MTSTTTRVAGCTAHTFTRPRGGARCSSTATCAHLPTYRLTYGLAFVLTTLYRRALQLDRYVVLFGLLPPQLLALLRRFYAHLRDDDVGGHAAC